MSVEVLGLSKYFGKQKVVDEIWFTAKRGEIVGFLGPNGAGKSTTMKMLTCYLPPSKGTARLNGHDILKESMEVRKKTGYLPENNPLYKELYVKEYLQFIAKLHRIADPKKRISEMIGMTGLETEESISFIYNCVTSSPIIDPLFLSLKLTLAVPVLSMASGDMTRSLYSKVV